MTWTLRHKGSELMDTYVLSASPASRFKRFKSVFAGCLLGAMPWYGGVAMAADHAGGPIVNSTVFSDQHIRSVTAITDVFGRSQRITAAIVEYDLPINEADIDVSQWQVNDRHIVRAYVTSQPRRAANGHDGRFVVLELDPEDSASVIFAPDVDQPATVVVSQLKTITAASGVTLAPTEHPVINTRQNNQIVDDFRQFTYVDAKTGLQLTYNLYIPKHYDPHKRYPLVLFMHDYGVTGTNPLRTLEQGLGAVSFASPEDQARHPAFVLAPQYPVALANDAFQTSEYVDVTARLVQALTHQYAIDSHRLYTTGQSGGCMASIALNLKYPELFAASLLVAGQWDPNVVAGMAHKKTWIIVSQDDDKAWPGMNSIVEQWEKNGAKVTRGTLNGRGNDQELADSIAKMLKDGPGSNVYFSSFEKGTVIPANVTSAASGHVWTWPIAYRIPAVRDWLLSQSK